VPQRLVAISISHHRAPVEVRERLQLSPSEINALLARLKESLAHEALIVSTCNRTELYTIPLGENIATASLIQHVLSAKGLDTSYETYWSYFETLSSAEAIEHLFHVIAGIDSQIIGDQQIFAQVKDAFRFSAEAQTTGTFFTKLSQAAFRVAKRVISETTLNTGAATISYAAVEFARKIYDDLKSRHILIIGAGESGELAAKHFVERSAGRITIANRNMQRAEEAVTRLQADGTSTLITPLALDRLASALPSADIIVSATSAPGYIVTRAEMKAALKERTSNSPVVLVDIAVPRDLDPEIGKLSNVFLKDIDDLRSIVDRNLERRKQEIPKAEAIIDEELHRFVESFSKLEIGPTIKELREKFDTVRQEELERHRGKLDEKQFAMIEDMTRRMINRLLHAPTITLKETSGSPDDQLSRVELVRKLFALDQNSEKE